MAYILDSRAASEDRPHLRFFAVFLILIGLLALWHLHLALRPEMRPYEHWTSFLAVVGVLAVLAPQQFVPHIPLGLALLVIIAVHSFGRYVYLVPPDAGPILAITIEPAFLILLICLARALGPRPVSDMRRSAAERPGLFLPQDQASHRILTEMARSRRHGRALSIILIDFPDDAERSSNRSRLLFEEGVSGKLRRSDFGVVLEETNRLVLICPETDLEGCQSHARRIAAIASEQPGRSARLSIACFPDHALTFGALLEHAELRLRNQPLREPTKSGAAHSVMRGTLSHSSTAMPPGPASSTASCAREEQ